MANKSWSVEICVEGRSILSISDKDLCGIESVSDYREEILEAADHLIAFIGRRPATFVPEDDLENEDD